MKCVATDSVGGMLAWCFSLLSIAITKAMTKSILGRKDNTGHPWGKARQELKLYRNLQERTAEADNGGALSLACSACFFNAGKPTNWSKGRIAHIELDPPISIRNQESVPPKDLPTGQYGDYNFLIKVPSFQITLVCHVKPPIRPSIWKRLWVQTATLQEPCIPVSSTPRV